KHCENGHNAGQDSVCRLAAASAEHHKQNAHSGHVKVSSIIKAIIPAGGVIAAMLSPQNAGIASVSECDRNPTIVSIQSTMIFDFLSILLRFYCLKICRKSIGGIGARQSPFVMK
ncbi:MAG: hypothetical protein J6Y55_07760, partial [Bacteroidales bacterium]|nr:hypothetical protein [Bacteroidales bacterium]